jgi:general secretion pathway protein K
MMTLPPMNRVATFTLSDNAEGFALVGAIASLLIFALVSLTIMTATQRSIAGGASEIDAARVAAAADAGFLFAVDGLTDADPAQRWTIDGRRRIANLGSVKLSIGIIDERGKVPLNLLDEETANALFEAMGLNGDQLRIARDSILDWLDDDDEPRAFGAEANDYLRTGLTPRNGALQSIDELGRIRGIDAALIRRMRDIVTVDFGSGAFDTRYAQPLAIAIMSGSSEPNAEVIARAREAAGQVTALAFIEQGQLIGRPLTIEVKATLGSSARTTKRCVIELTGTRARPYAVRSCS